MHRLWPDKPHEGRMPDLTIILNEKLQPGAYYATRAPDIAVEIVSPDDTWSGLFDKAALYMEKGRHQVWIVDPYQKGMLIVTPADYRRETGTLTCPEVLPGLALDVQAIFEWPAPARQEQG